MIEPGLGAIVHLSILHDPSQRWLLTMPVLETPQGDRGIGIASPIGLSHLLRRITRLVISDHEFRPGQGDGDVIPLHFNVKVRHQPILAQESSELASREWESLASGHLDPWATEIFGYELCSSTPLILGICTSTTRQDDSSTSADCEEASADAKL